MPDLLRIEVDGGRLCGGVIVYVQPPQLSTAQRDTVDAIVSNAVTNLRHAGVAHPHDALLFALVTRHADSQAYAREAVRRGVLAL